MHMFDSMFDYYFAQVKVVLEAESDALNII